MIYTVLVEVHVPDEEDTIDCVSVEDELDAALNRHDFRPLQVRSVRCIGGKASVATLKKKTKK